MLEDLLALWPQGILIALAAYFVGSVPTGYWFAKWFYGIDVTKNGSGNIGATNVARLTGKKWHFALILFLDAAKAAVTVFFAGYLKFDGVWAPWTAVLASTFLLLGNGFSPFLFFRGGKSVATLLGICTVLLPVSVTVLFIVFMALFMALFRKVAAASVFVTGLLPVFYFLLQPNFDPRIFGFLIFSAMWIAWRHRSNF
ncbi:glycerol-3-phosphate acyltransferase [Candidatus Dependentiae bacterium]